MRALFNDMQPTMQRPRNQMAFFQVEFENRKRLNLRKREMNIPHILVRTQPLHGTSEAYSCPVGKIHLLSL